MVRYSPRAAKALGYLKRHYNDVEVYVEDTTSNNMWRRLLELFLPRGLKLTSVNFLGGRDRVLAACRLDQGDDQRKRIYIIDADFDFLRGKRKDKLKHLHRMPCYCVENLLMSESAVTNAAFDCCTNSQLSSLEAKISDPLDGCEDLVRRLFTVYAACEHLGLGLKTVKNGHYPFVSKVGRQKRLDREKLWRKIRALTREAIKIAGAQRFSKVRKSIHSRSLGLPIQKVVSGKDFLLPYLWNKLREIADFSANIDHFKVHLAKSVNPSIDPILRKKFRSFAI